MNSNSPLFATSPENLVLRVKAGDSESAFLMGLVCLSGLGVEQNLMHASSYFIKAKQLGAKDTEVFIAYINECSDRMIAAVDTYVGNDMQPRNDLNMTGMIEARFKKVKSERARIVKVLNEYGLPDCPFDTAFNDLLNDWDSKKRSLSDLCSIVSLSEDNEGWCRDTAQLLYEEGQDGLARMWLNKSHPESDDELLIILQKESEKRLLKEVTVEDVVGDSLLKDTLHIRILPDGLIKSKDRITKALAEWSQSCQKQKEEYCEEQRRMAEEKQRKAEEEARRKEMDRSFNVGRYGRQRNVIDDMTVSRNHCRVTFIDDDRVEIENLSKANGTVVNGEKIEKTIVSMDSVLKMGNYTVKVRDLFPPREQTSGPNKEHTQ